MQNIYIIIPVLISGVYLFIQLYNIYQVESVGGVLKYRMKWLPALLISITLIYYTWQRPLYFGDTYSYKIIFDNIPSLSNGLDAYLTIHPEDPGFSVLISLVKTIGLDYRTFLLLVAIFQAGAVTFFFRRYSSSYFLSILLFVLSTDYYSWMWNGMRQFIAVCITLLATPLIINKKYLTVSLLILFASLFHQSALIMIPVVFIVQGRPFNKRTLTIILLSITVLFTVDLFTDFLDSSLVGTNYSSIVSDVQTGAVGNDDGTNPLRVLVYSVPTFLALLGYKIIRYKNDKVIDISTNMAVLTFCLFVISMVTSGIYIGRVPIYFSLYNYLLLPWEVRNIFTNRSQNIVLFLMIALYLAFYYYQMFLAW